MKKFLILAVFVLGALSASTQNKSERIQVSALNGYGEIPGHGDLTWRSLQIRYPFIGSDERRCHFGFMAGGTQVISKIYDYVYKGEELAFGLTFEFCPNQGASNYSTYSWINTGYKISSDFGGIRFGNDIFQSHQKDEIIFVDLGIVFNNQLDGFLDYNKITAGYQNPISSVIVSKLNSVEINNPPWNKEYYYLMFDGSLFSHALNASESILLVPSAYLGYSHETGSQSDFGQYGLRLIIRRAISNQEVFIFSGGFKITKKSLPMLELSVNANITEIIRLARGN